MPRADSPVPDLEGAVTHGPARELDRFLAQVERRAFRMAQIATRDREAALDAVQDTMLNFARHYAQRPSGQWRPLFFRVLQNRIRDWHRREAVRRRIFFWRDPADAESGQDFLNQFPAAPAQEAPELLAREQALKRLEAALRGLPTRQREAFELRIWEGLPVAETAQAMGCSQGSVKTHLSRALASLRAQLQGAWP